MIARDNQPTAEHVGSMETPYGRLSINKGAAFDHATMRSAQLGNLILLMMGDSSESFGLLRTDVQSSLFWLAQQLAHEVEACIPFVAQEAREVKP
jgi:hypothetical protein